MIDYKLVPVEPTPEMRRKAGLIRGADYYTITKVWHAMIDAAPTAPTTHGPLPLSDEKILEIASNPMNMPCSPWWLKSGVKLGDVQNAAITFARAVLKAAECQLELAKYQPCGCVICTCEHETQCQGCGGHHCGAHPVG